ncbi:uncharacterized protein A4U43_C02F100 [Asparagus officinalis]|uniref:Protein kinase domain-containing protein n=1 Tax=Asparagus officinalis TaxID=4686 RepID=A0A5P1FGH1_ASPOF|nr:uncharacterized protein A4U43_C02F100 [Asparagus officinalis]
MVYEYMPNGNLDTWLHPVEADRCPQMKRLTFAERLNIAMDVASTLEYLHHHCYRCIVHCYLKPSNVLLDNDMIARVGDFGLSRSLPEVIGDCSEDQLISFRIKESVGYLAPGKPFPNAFRNLNQHTFHL